MSIPADIVAPLPKPSGANLWVSSRPPGYSEAMKTPPSTPEDLVPTGASLRHATVRGRRLTVLSSGASMWLIDEEARRFCRAPLGADVIDSDVHGEWRPYDELVIDAETGAITITNATHILRAWLAGSTRNPSPGVTAGGVAR
jgi:hypothetical protein